MGEGADTLRALCDAGERRALRDGAIFILRDMLATPRTTGSGIRDQESVATSGLTRIPDPAVVFVEAARHCWNNRHLVRVLDRRREPFQLANLRPIHEDVDEAPHLASLIAQLLPDTRVGAFQSIE